MDKNQSRTKIIVDYLRELSKGEKGKDLYNKYFNHIEGCTPVEMLDAVDKIMLEEPEIESLKAAISKMLNLLHNSLNAYDLPGIKKDSFLYYFEENNKELDKQLKELRTNIKILNNDTEEEQVVKLRILTQIEKIGKFVNQYSIKENILFPFIEKELPNYRCLHVMWSIHDDIKKSLKEIKEILDVENFDLDEFNQLIGDLYFDMYAIKFREEKILFPVILEKIDLAKLDKLLDEVHEIGFPYVNPEKKKIKEDAPQMNFDQITLSTGKLNLTELELIFNHLPVDLTYVDATDTVRYFSSPKERIFPRAKAIIGRKVQNCHPPESIDIVNKILDGFKKGEKDRADFWINMNEQFILIQYYALRDENDDYYGTLEVSMNATFIRNLKGEQRLLDWK